MPSTKETSFLTENIVLKLNNKQLSINIYDTPLGKRWIEALKDNLKNKRILEKNFCWLGWADSNRNLKYLVEELNNAVDQINSFTFDPPYESITNFNNEDFQGPKSNEYRLKHDACNLLHRHFEELQGSAWGISKYYKQADYKTKYSIRQLNNLCHEIEGYVDAYRKKHFDPKWMRPSQITTFLNAPRYDLHTEDFELFKENRYKRELGGVYLHWSQVGKTLFEVYRDEHGPKMTDALCSEINHQKYYSGEFDIEWGETIGEDSYKWKKHEMDGFRHWLELNGYDWDDSELSLGYIKLGQVDMKLGFENKTFLEVYDVMKDNLNIKNISVVGSDHCQNNFPYTLESDDWKQLQIDYLKVGYESRSMR